MKNMSKTRFIQRLIRTAKQERYKSPMVPERISLVSCMRSCGQDVQLDLPQGVLFQKEEMWRSHLLRQR
jgi:hypothetical protein